MPLAELLLSHHNSMVTVTDMDMITDMMKKHTIDKWIT
jgi:hypothetical protein